MPSHRDPGFWAGYQRAICIWGFGGQKISNVRAALFKRQIYGTYASDRPIGSRRSGEQIGKAT
mgnify:CR=1 FL=1